MVRLPSATRLVDAVPDCSRRALSVHCVSKMGAKKKGKGSKLARMSEEERLRYLQHRAAIEEEARRRKEQLIATFMKVRYVSLECVRTGFMQFRKLRVEFVSLYMSLLSSRTN